MKCFSISLECQINSDDVKYISDVYNLVVVDVTRFYIEDCKRRNPESKYCGLPVYMFVGSIVNVYRYVRFMYGIDMSDSEIEELMKEVKVCEI